MGLLIVGDIGNQSRYVLKAQAEKALNSFITVTTAALKDGNKIALVGFGTFSAVSRPLTHLMFKISRC